MKNGSGVSAVCPHRENGMFPAGNEFLRDFPAEVLDFCLIVLYNITRYFKTNRSGSHAFSVSELQGDCLCG